MDAVVSEVQEVFATLTRYPFDVLDPEADLEEDLGIDSVKRAEILAVFRERYALPDTLEVSPEQLSSIARIAEVLRPYVDGASPRETVATVDHTPAVAATHAAAQTPAHLLGSNNGNAGPSATVLSPATALPPMSGGGTRPRQSDLERIVRDTFVEVTRYPEDLLIPDAQLEDDLGIDSVKLAEVLAVLRDRLELPEPEPSAALRQIRTISDVVSAVSAVIGDGRDQGPEDAPAVRPADAGTRRASPAPTTAHHLLGTAAPFAGKIALVTGSGHGIGRAIALQLADLGASVIVNSFHSRTRGEETAATIRRSGHTAEHMWGSVANPTHVKRLFAEIDARFGGLDFLVCNASNGIIAPLSDVTDVHWDRAFRTNVVGLHQAALLAASLMRRRGGGRIVTLSSPGAHRYITHFGCMGPIKAAVETLTLYLAIELAADNIQVNCVSAGPIYGELLSKYPEADRLIPYWESLSAGRRLGEESDIASFVAYLLSDSARKITGSVMLVDSGGSQRI